jgi:hypothetical protein
MGMVGAWGWWADENMMRSRGLLLSLSASCGAAGPGQWIAERARQRHGAKDGELESACSEALACCAHQWASSTAMSPMPCGVAGGMMYMFEEYRNVGSGM